MINQEYLKKAITVEVTQSHDSVNLLANESVVNFGVPNEEQELTTPYKKAVFDYNEPTDVKFREKKGLTTGKRNKKDSMSEFNINDISQRDSAMDLDSADSDHSQSCLVEHQSTKLDPLKSQGKDKGKRKLNLNSVSQAPNPKAKG